MTTAAIFYFVMIILATGFAYLATRVRFVKNPVGMMCGGKSKNQLNTFFVGMSFLTLFFVVAFSTSGTDYHRYERWFLNDSQEPLAAIFQSEWAYLLFNRFVHYFTSDFRVYVVIYSAVVLYLVYSTLVKYADKINFSWAVFIYGTQFYLPMCSAKRSTLAAVLVFYLIRYLIEKKYIKYIVGIIIASAIHTSALLWMFFFLAYIAIKENLYKRHKIVLIMGFIAISALLIATRDYWITLGLSERYEQYGVSFSGIGLGLVLKFSLLFFLCVRWGIKRGEPGDTSDYWRIGIISSCVSLVYAIAGYTNQVFTRMNIYSMYSFVFFVPFLVMYWKKSESNVGNVKMEIALTKVVLIAYMIFMYIDYANGTMLTSGLGTYETIWGWSI